MRAGLAGTRAGGAGERTLDALRSRRPATRFPDSCVEREGSAWWLKASIGLAVALMVTLRLVALRSDAYGRLCWNTGLLTDEGYYTTTPATLYCLATQEPTTGTTCWSCRLCTWRS